VAIERTGQRVALNFSFSTGMRPLIPVSADVLDKLLKLLSNTESAGGATEIEELNLRDE
jgi:hypothetical protein